MNAGRCRLEWCEVDHDISGTTHVGAYAGTPVRGAGMTLVSMVGIEAEDEGRRCPRVVVGREDVPRVLVSACVHVAPGLAQFLEILSDATPVEIRELAQKVRAAHEAVDR